MKRKWFCREHRAYYCILDDFYNVAYYSDSGRIRVFDIIGVTEDPTTKRCKEKDVPLKFVKYIKNNIWLLDLNTSNTLL